MVFRISISVSRFSTDARLRLLLLTHLTATTSRVSFCPEKPPWSPDPLGTPPFIGYPPHHHHQVPLTLPYALYTVA